MSHRSSPNNQGSSGYLQQNKNRATRVKIACRNDRQTRIDHPCHKRHRQQRPCFPPVQGHAEGGFSARTPAKQPCFLPAQGDTNGPSIVHKGFRRKTKLRQTTEASRQTVENRWKICPKSVEEVATIHPKGVRNLADEAYEPGGKAHEVSPQSVRG